MLIRRVLILAKFTIKTIIVEDFVLIIIVVNKNNIDIKIALIK